MKRYDVTVITHPRTDPLDRDAAPRCDRLRLIYRGLPRCGHDCAGYIVHQRIPGNAPDAIVHPKFLAMFQDYGALPLEGGAFDEPEPRDMDTPLRLDQDRRDCAEWESRNL